MFLHETFTVLHAAGTALILFGAWNANREPSGGSTNQTEREEER
jgi:drug/metabolite transporter (DMT)-like permease